jgi:hypothetical protein
MEKSIPEFETDLHRALNALKEQGLNIESAFVGTDGFVFPVSGYLLTTAQILMLRRAGKLDLQGIIEFDAHERETVECDILSARKRIRPEELKSWSALDLCFIPMGGLVERAKCECSPLCSEEKKRH